MDAAATAIAAGMGIAAAMRPVELTAAPVADMPAEHMAAPLAADMPERRVVIAAAPAVTVAAAHAVIAVAVPVVTVAVAHAVDSAAVVMPVVASVAATRVAAATAAVVTDNFYDFPSPERPVCFGRRAFCVGMKTNRGWSSSWYPRSQNEIWGTPSSLPHLI
jgi:hypothetical protein